jgi:hypothetical protein
MATDIYYFKGTCKWAKVHKPDEKYGNYEINLYMDPKSWELFNKSGLRLETREDEDGEYICFRRPQRKLIKGDLVEFDPPVVIFNDEKTDKLIGNGSTVTIKVSVYDTQKGKGHRLEKVRVDELVEYAGGNSPEVHDDVLDNTSPF